MKYWKYNDKLYNMGLIEIKGGKKNRVLASHLSCHLSRKLVTIRNSTFGFPFRIDIAVEFSGRLEHQSDRVSCGYFRAVPTARISSFIQQGVSRWVTCTRTRSILEFMARDWKKWKPKKHTRDVSRVVLIFTCDRVFSFVNLTPFQYLW